MRYIEYNGWTNYATWRVSLDYGLCDGECSNYPAWLLKDMVKEHIASNCDNETTISYAMTFLDDVNWNEIERNIKEG